VGVSVRIEEDPISQQESGSEQADMRAGGVT